MRLKVSNALYHVPFIFQDFFFLFSRKKTYYILYFEGKLNIHQMCHWHYHKISILLLLLYVVNYSSLLSNFFSLSLCLDNSSSVYSNYDSYSSCYESYVDQLLHSSSSLQETFNKYMTILPWWLSSKLMSSLS
jgi:hypothetical protein